MRDLRGRLHAYRILRAVSGEHAAHVEKLIQRSANYIYRRKMGSYHKKIFNASSGYMAQEDGGPIILSYMLDAAESDRRILEKEIERQRAEVDQLKKVNLYLSTLRGASGTILKKLGFIREE